MYNVDITHNTTLREGFITPSIRTVMPHTVKSATNNFGTLYEKHVDRVYGFLMRRVGEKETAQDLTSQTFVKALSNFDLFDERKGMFSVWIVQIARNTLIDWYRTHKVGVSLEDAFDIPDVSDALGNVALKEDIRTVREYMRSLTAKQREIVLMRVWDDMTYKEIADVLGESEASCKVAFSRAIAKLRKDVVLTFVVLIFQTFIR